jgi:hypothetical protein
VAPGDNVVVAGNVGISLGLSSGTSLASPMLAGALASLWSAFPEKTAAEILDGVFASADQDKKPDNGRGYGLPDMTQAWIGLGEMSPGNGGLFSFDRTNQELTFRYASDFFQPGDQVELRNDFGHKASGISAAFVRNEVSTLKISGLKNLKPGHYQILLINKFGVKRLGAAVWK